MSGIAYHGIALALLAVSVHNCFPALLGRYLRMAVGELEERLASRVGIRDPAVVHERDIVHSPRQQRPRDTAPEGPSAEQQARRASEHVRVELRQLPPAHESQVEVHGFLRETGRVHE